MMWWWSSVMARLTFGRVPSLFFFSFCVRVCVCVWDSRHCYHHHPVLFFLFFLKNKTPLKKNKKDAVPPGQTHDEWWGAFLHVSTRCVVRSLLLAAGCTALSLYDLDSFRLIAIFIFVFSDISIEHFPSPFWLATLCHEKFVSAS